MTPVLMTPALAQRILAERNQAPTQRRLCPVRAEEFADVIRSGRWELGSRIEFQGGELTNGQHRLHAVAAVGTPVVMCVEGVGHD